jgi:hypothetical protein
MQLIDKIFALKLLGCEITEDAGRYYARGGYIKNNLKHEYWERVESFVIDWNFVIAIHKSFGESTFTLSLTYYSTPEDTLLELIQLNTQENKENFGGMKLYDKSKLDEPRN